MQCIPYHILYLMGAGYLLLIAVIFFFCIKKPRSKGKVSYVRFRSDEENNEPTVSHYKPESYNTLCDNNLSEKNYQKFGHNSITENVSPVREDYIKKRLVKNNEENVEINSNIGQTVFIPPDIMEKICEAVLSKKNTTTTESQEKESNLSNEFQMTKIQCDSSDYDIVPTAKSVQLRISSYLNDAEVSSKDDMNPARESYYKQPITLKMAYVNANKI